MTTWVLIFYVYAGPGVAEFNTFEACQVALATIKKELSVHAGVCLKK